MTKPNRTQPPIIAPYLFQNALPLALLASGEPVMIGHLKLLRISPERYRRELELGILDLFRIGHFYALEICVAHEGPWTDFLVER